MSDSARILVVDDEPDMRALIVDMLAARSVTVTVSNAVDAIPPLDWEPFDLMIIDLNLPELAGEEAIKMIRGRPAGVDLPIIAISADPALHERLLGVDVQAILEKPFTATKLLDTVEELLQRPRPARELPSAS